MLIKTLQDSWWRWWFRCYVMAESCDPVDLSPPGSSFPRQEYWSGLPFPLPGDLPHPGTEHASAALVGGFFTSEPPGKHEAGTVPIL